MAPRHPEFGVVMSICGAQSCACSLVSSTLSISGSGTPASPWVLEQAEFTDLTQLQVDVDNLEAEMAVKQGEVSGLQNDMAAAEGDIVRLDAMSAGASTVTTGTTSGGTGLVVETFTFPALVAASHIWVFGSVLFTKTVATDVFSLATRVDGTPHTPSLQDRAGASAGSIFSMGGPTGVAAAAAPVVDMVLTRVSGTGTATVTSGTLRWLALPT